MTSRPSTDTASGGGSGPSAEGGASPGIVIVFGGGRARFHAIALRAGEIVVGRALLAKLDVGDARVSQRHVRVGAGDEGWLVEDLGSRNGTYVDGARVDRRSSGTGPSVVRIGDTLFFCVDDVTPYLGGEVVTLGSTIVGPTLAEAWRRIERASRTGDVVHLHGETGVGKELAARHFHASGPHAAGPFVPLNCATVPVSLAERILFGVRRGTFTGADADADGVLHAAHRGVLFLDEVLELDPSVQAKLLRALETRQVVRLGGSTPTTVRFGLCSASAGRIDDAVEREAFRRDLFYRIGLPTIEIAPLRRRREEIPWIIEVVLGQAQAPPARASLIEQALCREWPGNVRELVAEIRQAARSAVDAGADGVRSAHLRREAGRARGASRAEDDEAERSRAALEAERGNVTAAARRLGVHRTQLRRALARLSIDPRLYRRRS